MPRYIINCCFIAQSILLPLLVGCGESEKISTYKFTELRPAKNAIPSKETGPDVMLAAMVPEKMERVWTFKATVSKAELESQRKVFDELVKSVAFKNELPTWTVPEGWKEEKGQNRFVYAILKPLDESSTAKISVSEIPRKKQALADLMRANVNRWRGQMGLRGISDIKLAEEMRELKTKAKKAYVFEIVGTFKKSNSMQAAPHGRFGGVPHGPMNNPANEKVDPAKLAANLPFTYKAPENWQQILANSEGKLEFVINDGAVVIVNLLPKKSKTNIDDAIKNMRTGFGLKPHSEDEAAKATEEIDFAGQSRRFWAFESGENHAPKNAVRMAELRLKSDVWGIVLAGRLSVVKKETAHFKEFLSSIKIKTSKKDVKKSVEKATEKPSELDEKEKVAPEADVLEKPNPKKAESRKNASGKVKPNKATPQKLESSTEATKPAVDDQTSNIQLRSNRMILC